MIMAAIVTQSAWAIITPSWSFSVATDKSTYRLGEDVKITASLKNTGYITHSFKSLVNNPVLITVFWHRGPYDWPGQSVWWNHPWEENITEFSVLPSQALERDFVWNQTNILGLIHPYFSWNQTYMPGTYTIEAFVPEPEAEVLSQSYALFITSVDINVTSS